MDGSLSLWADQNKPGIQLFIFRLFFSGLDPNIYSGFKLEIHFTLILSQRAVIYVLRKKIKTPGLTAEPEPRDGGEGIKVPLFPISTWLYACI